MNQLTRQNLRHWTLVAALLLVSVTLGALGLMLSWRATVAMLTAAAACVVAFGWWMHTWSDRQR